MTAEAAGTALPQAELVHAFRLFEEASASLQSEYAGLRGEVARLRAEVEEKNALLAAEMEEQRRWRLFLTELLERIPGGILVTNPSGELVASNGQAERLLALPESPLPGVMLSSLGEAGKRIAEAARQDGSRTIALEFGSGETVRVEMTRSELPGCAGGTAGYLLLLTDVTDARLRSDQTERAARLASMGEMAAKIAHEVRNPLTACRLFLEMAIQDARQGLPDETLQNLGKLEGVIGAIECTVSNMLGFIRDHRPAAVPIDPGAIARESVDYVRALLDDRAIEARVVDAIAGGEAVSDPGLLRQLFLNLLLNAIQAIPAAPGGRIDIALSERLVQDADGERPYLRFTVRDNGCGIPEPLVSRIFDPFFTTRGEGTGLGLTVVQSILTALGGFAEVNSRPGRGTAFSVLIPRMPRTGGAS
ncbi:MAG TPA: ATP-binding protein [Candidatus Deferrimicrobiaceae bacterium]|jgi:signal transduction histidine kinase